LWKSAAPLQQSRLNMQGPPLPRTATPSAEVALSAHYWLGRKGFAYSGRYPTCSEPRIHRSNQVTIRCCDQRVLPENWSKLSHTCLDFSSFS
jgi:hypothetical protein